MNDRRKFLKSSLASSAALATLRLPPLQAQDVAVKPGLVQLAAGIEPTVRLIESTPRGELMELMARRVASGLSYQEVLAALLLAGVRNVQPRPSVGFKFHSVLVVNSAHLASLASPDQDRWLPVFWALDYFKGTQAEEEQKTGWKLQPVDEGRVPTASKARQAFVSAMESWDPEAADAAVAGMARHAGAHELFELFCRFGARDFRSIGHKAIYVANSFRTLQCIGWRHAEPVLRSLAFALQNHSGESNPAESDHSADRDWRENLERVQTLKKSWNNGNPNADVAREFVHLMRTATSGQAAQFACDSLNRGVSPQSLWDGVLLGSGELLMQQPGIVGLHALTTSNALHYAFQSSSQQESRQMLLLQACSFVPLFRESAAGRGELKQTTIEDLMTSADGLKDQDPSDALGRIFESISGNRMNAARDVLAYARSDANAHEFLDEARRMIFLKGRDAHDYKFSSAVLEDYYHVSPELRDLFLALSVFNLKGSGHEDNQLVTRIRAAMPA